MSILTTCSGSDALEAMIGTLRGCSPTLSWPSLLSSLSLSRVPPAFFLLFPMVKFLGGYEKHPDTKRPDTKRPGTEKVDGMFADKVVRLYLCTDYVSFALPTAMEVQYGTGERWRDPFISE